MSSPADVAVIVVGYNSREYVDRCLQSLVQADWRRVSYQIVYVDNASTDGSVEMVRRQFPNAAVLPNVCNEGFCRACNQGVAASAGRYVYLLNNDTFVYPDSVLLLFDFLEKEQKAAAAGNRLLNSDLSDQWSARRFPTWRNALAGRRSWLGRILPQSGWMKDYLYKDQMSQGSPFAVDWIPGSCTLVRRAAYRQAGGLPENMHYWSDAVFCDRLRRAGWEIYIVPAARLIHFEGHGTGNKTAATRRWLISDFHRGAFRFFCEHYELKPWSPIRWVAGTALGLRAGLLVLRDSISIVTKLRYRRT